MVREKPEKKPEAAIEKTTKEKQTVPLLF